MIGATSVAGKILKIMQRGWTITPHQIKQMYGVANPHNPVYLLEQSGIRVNREYHKSHFGGYEYVIYSLNS